MLFILLNILPDSKSAPLASCAFIILSVSSTRIGIKRSAIDIIIATSCTGTFTLFNGLRSFSIASVSWLGVVASVIIEDPIIRNTSLNAINTVLSIPSSVIVIIPNFTSTLPPDVQKRLSIAVKTSINNIGFIPLITNLNGTLDNFIIHQKKTAAIM